MRAMNDIAPKGLGGGLTNYGDPAFAAYLRRSFARSMGYSRELLSKPVVGITWTASGFNNCHRGVPELIEAVKRGVLAAGALPLDFPVISLGEVFLSPTSMMYRNLMAMSVVEMIRAQPMDAVVLVGGCDKTLPALVMGAASAGKPAIVLATGPMMTSRYRGERLGACTDCRRFWAKYRAGGLDSDEIETIEGRLATTEGTCAVMGTASTMAILIEVLGLWGSTNAVVHLAAMAGRLGLKLDFDRLNALSDETPVLVDLKPTGEGYMEDFFAAGGVGGLLQRMRGAFDLSARTDAPALDVAADDALVLRNAGPKACGMPEAGYLPIPRKLAAAGVKDMLRLSDARMSGTAFGTIVLHIAPEAADGGPLDLVRNGDRIRLDVPARRLDLMLEE